MDRGSFLFVFHIKESFFVESCAFVYNLCSIEHSLSVRYFGREFNIRGM